MDLVYPNCAGLDVHKDSVSACLVTRSTAGERSEVLRRFGTMTAHLQEMAKWMKAYGCTTVAMESTGSYWKPVFNILEEDFEVVLVNPAHMKNVPGRKTDTKDSQWIAQLLEHGLLKGSFIPPHNIRALRDYTRYRRKLTEERSAEANRVQKILEDCNIKLGSVASDPLGVSGRAMLSAMLAGTTDPAELAQLARGRLREKIPQLELALAGIVKSEHSWLLTQMLAHIDYLDESIEKLGRQIDEACRPFEEETPLLDSIPGVDKSAAQDVIAEVGVDMGQFPSHKHLSSWSGMSPGNNESAGKRKSGRTAKGNKHLKAALTRCAHAAGRTKNTYVHALYQRFTRRRSRKHAAIVVAHHILEAVWFILHDRQPYRELGANYLEQCDKEHAIQRHLKQLTSLGVVIPESVVATSWTLAV